MATIPNNRSVSLKFETVELLKTLKSCFHLGRKKDLSYDEIVTLLIMKGLESIDPKVNKLLQLSLETDDNNEDTSEDTEIKNIP